MAEPIDVPESEGDQVISSRVRASIELSGWMELA